MEMTAKYAASHLRRSAPVPDENRLMLQTGRRHHGVGDGAPPAVAGPVNGWEDLRDVRT